MYSIEQVKPYLTSPDTDTRELAEDYFNCPLAPLLSADEWWDAFDVNQHVPTSLRFHVVMKSTQSSASVQRLIDLTNQDSGPVRVVDELERALIHFLPLPALRDFAEQILSGLTSPFEVANVRDRLALLELPVEQLWTRLEQISTDNQGNTYSRLPIALNDIEHALASHGDAILERTINEIDRILKDPKPGYESWMPMFAVSLIGKLRHAPSVGRLFGLIEGIEDPFNDSLATEALDSLVRIGTSELLDSAEEMCSRHPKAWTDAWCLRLVELNTPAVEEFLTRQLLRMTDDSIRTSIALSLVTLCTTHPPALEAIRTMVVEDRWNTTIDDPLRSLIPLCHITGWSPPELSYWKSIYDTPERNAELKSRFDRLFTGGDPAMQKTLDQLREMFMSETQSGPVAEPVRDLPAAPFVRSAPKVGRNDPCPCGSGVKYKKCCGK